MLNELLTRLQNIKSRKNTSDGGPANWRGLLRGGTRKKLILIALILVILFPLFARPTQAFYTPNASYPFQFWNAVFQTEEMNLQSFVYETFKATFMSVWTSIGLCLTCSPGQPMWGALGTVTQFIAMTYDNPPASGVRYLAYLGNKLDLVPEVYAQGTGFGRFDILLPIWQRFRDITYVFFILVIVFMGFAIMFRVKTSPQTVITLQSALPRIVLGLILITFSYAIVGFMVDIMLIIANLIISTFGGMPEIPSLMRTLLPDPPVTGNLAFGATIMAIGFYPIFIAFGLLIIASGLSGLLLAPTLVGATIPVVGGIAIAVIVLIVFLIALFRLFWSLLKAYINVILAVILGPFQILIGTLPGNQGIGNWFRNLLSNLAVFPVVLLMVFLAGYLCLYSTAGLDPTTPLRLYDVFIGQAEWSEAFPAIIQIFNGLGNPIQEIGTLFLMFFVSLGILLMTPKAAEMIQTFMAGKPFGYGSAVGAAFGPVTAGYGMARQPGLQFAGDVVGKEIVATGGSAQIPAAPSHPRWRWAGRILEGLGYRPTQYP